MKISRKLFVGFALVICFAVIIGVIGLAGMQKLRVAGLAMYEKQVVGLECIGKAAAAFKQGRVDCRQVIVNSFYDDMKGAVDARKQFEASTKEFEYWMNESYKIAPTEDARKFHETIMALFHKAYLPDTERIIYASIADMPDHINKLQINVMLATITEVSDRTENLIIGLMNLNTALAKQTSIDNDWITQVFIIMQYWLLIIAVIIAALIMFYIIRDIAEPVKEAADVLGEIAKGNFDKRVEGDYKGDFELIKNSVNDTAMKLSLYLGEKIWAQRSAHEADLAKARVEAASEAVFASINYAVKIQKNLLPKDEEMSKAFSDYSVIWEPRDIVGGDIYWLKNFDKGSLLCVCDCTGHGTPGALLTMLVASIFETEVNEENCHDTAEIMWRLEQRMVNTLNVSATDKEKSKTNISDFNDGCDLAVLFAAKDGSATVSAGNIHVFICDGKEVSQIKGQRIFIGDGALKTKEDIKTITIPKNTDNKFYIATDGLYDQIGGASEKPFGYKRFKQIILENHHETQAAISNIIWREFENYRGDQPRRDDVELVAWQVSEHKLL